MEVVLEALIRRGWCFRDVEEVKGLIQINIALSGELGSVDSVESELLNLDLKSIGGKSLPDLSTIKKSTHLQGPKVLQIVSVRDISQSTVEAYSKISHSRRLLRFGLTDGHSEIVAIEYSSIPSMKDNIAPGTKVRLENKAAVHNGILCLNPKTIAILGGLVQSLYEEWEMSQKYSSFSRSSLRVSQKIEIDGPPPFEKLQIGAHPHQIVQQHIASYPPESTSKASGTSVVKLGGFSYSKQVVKNQVFNAKEDGLDGSLKAPSITGNSAEKPSTSESRTKEVAEAVPVQNQAAAQKLLQKISEPARDDRQSGGRKHREKGKQEESSVFTLDEWERMKRGNPVIRNNVQDISHDEELAWQLQDQLDLEDCHVKGDPGAEAEKIRMSMFNYDRGEGRNQYQMGSRGRGRGRGRGRERGRR